MHYKLQTLVCLVMQNQITYFLMAASWDVALLSVAFLRSDGMPRADSVLLGILKHLQLYPMISQDSQLRR